MDYIEALRLLLDKHGQFYPIVRTKYGIVDGRKRLKALTGSQPNVLDKTPKFLDIEVNNPEEYCELVKALAPIRLTGKNLKNYILDTAEDLLNKNFEPGQIISMLHSITGVSPQYIGRVLPDKYKDAIKQTTLRNKVSHTHNKPTVEESTTKPMSYIDMLDVLLDWLDKDECPPVNDEERPRLLALKDLLNKWFSDTYADP